MTHLYEEKGGQEMPYVYSAIPCVYSLCTLSCESKKVSSRTLGKRKTNYSICCDQRNTMSYGKRIAGLLWRS